MNRESEAARFTPQTQMCYLYVFYPPLLCILNFINAAVFYVWDSGKEK